MERCVYKYMYNFFITNNLTYLNQSGFLVSGHSTTYQLISLYRQLVESLIINLKPVSFFVIYPKLLKEFGTKG